MQLTPFGKELRKLRIERDWKLKDMASGIKVTPSFLSGVETGEKAIPSDLIERIAHWGKLSATEVDTLHRAADASIKAVSMKLPEQFGARDREAMSVLARIIDERNIDDWERIRDHLLAKRR